jgi:hypothetical protein
MPLTVSVGTYEGHLYGWTVKSVSGARAPSDAAAAAGASGAAALEYAFKAGENPLRAAACGGPGSALLAVSSEESIIVFDTATRKQVGTLVHHTDTVTALAFPSRATLLSTDKAGTLCIWDCRTWTPALSVRAHKGGVACVAVHPSGRVALTAGTSDGGVVRLWDLTKGKPVHTQRVLPPSGPASASASASASAGASAKHDTIMAVEWVPGGSDMFVVLWEHAGVALYGDRGGEGAEGEAAGAEGAPLRGWAVPPTMPQPGRMITLTLLRVPGEAGGWIACAGSESGCLMVCGPSWGQGVAATTVALAASTKRVKRLSPFPLSSVVAGSSAGEGLVCVQGDGTVALYDVVQHALRVRDREAASETGGRSKGGTKTKGGDDVGKDGGEASAPLRPLVVLKEAAGARATSACVRITPA